MIMAKTASIDAEDLAIKTSRQTHFNKYDK